MNNETKSFQLDKEARSFRVSDFSLRELPLYALSLFLLTFFTLGIGWFLKFLPDKGRWICLGLAVGFYFGIVFATWCRRFAARNKDSIP